MIRRLLFLDQFDELGGAQRCLLDLLPAFLEAGYEAHLAIPGDGPLALGARACGVSVHRIPCSAYASGYKTWSDVAQFCIDLPRQVSRITSLVSEHRIDLIYVNGPRLLPAATIAAGGKPLIFHAHSIVAGAGSAALVRWALRSRRANVIAGCRFVLASFGASLGSSRSRVIYNGVRSLDCSPKRRNAEPRRIGVIGRIAPEKGQLEFVRAARLLLSQPTHCLPRCRFVICGDALFSSRDYGRRVRSEAEGLPVEFTGWRDEVRGILEGLDLLVVPSSGIEATTRVILEAFSAGVPVVAFRSGGIPEVIEDGITGVLTEPTPRALASRLSDLIWGGDGFLDAMSQRARAVFASRFSLDRYRSEILAVVGEAL